MSDHNNLKPPPLRQGLLLCTFFCTFLVQPDETCQNGKHHLKLKFLEFTPIIVDDEMKRKQQCNNNSKVCIIGGIRPPYQPNPLFLNPIHCHILDIVWIGFPKYRNQINQPTNSKKAERKKI